MNFDTKDKDDIVKIQGNDFYSWYPELAFESDDPLNIGKIFYLIGRKGTGKTTALFNILYKLRHMFWGAYAFVGSATTMEQLREVMPIKVVTDGFSKLKLEEIYIKIQKLIHKYGKRKYDLKRHHFLIILDDVCWDKRVLNLPILRKFHMNCRHIGATIIICAQYVMDLGPDKRSQIDYAFMLRNSIPKEIEKIRENYVPVMDKDRKHEFGKIFTTLSVPGRIMVIDATAANKTKDVTRIIGFFKTKMMEDIPPFTFGSDEFWACSLRIPKRYLIGPSMSSKENDSKKSSSSSSMNKNSDDDSDSEKELNQNHYNNLRHQSQIQNQYRSYPYQQQQQSQPAHIQQISNAQAQFGSFAFPSKMMNLQIS